jgi:membrane carboxypeptidase/penicillin-binding protein PbpC
VTFVLARDTRGAYARLASARLLDRYGTLIQIKPNVMGYYMQPLDAVPENFVRALVKKEDRLFFLHPGLNPWSIVRDGVALIRHSRRYGSSTLTQQLAKVLLGTEGERTLAHKAREALYALSLELWASKRTVLAMYASSVYFGHQMQGLEEASRFYFNKPPVALTDYEAASLVATIGLPSLRYPGTTANRQATEKLLASTHGQAGAAHVSDLQLSATIMSGEDRARVSDAAFETTAFEGVCKKSDGCTLTIDVALTERLRAMVSEHLLSRAFDGVKNGAIVVIKLPENELLALVGSPYPRATIPGAQINMALEPRPIGSTAKPLFYLKAFEKGARPYTRVEDREYKYKIETGFEFYPKNYDGRFRGDVTLHEALANSLNVPSVKVLEYVGLPVFYDFLTETLQFKPLQPLESYALGIALGGLEMDLLTLAHYYTLFPNEGRLRPLIIARDGTRAVVSGEFPPMESPLLKETRVAEKSYVALINRILSDRETGVEQFGIKSFLNLPAESYALKTGTSRDFHDSWTVGYTSDFLVGVWVGNHDNTPMPHVSGQSGAGRIWHDAMEIMLNSPYHNNTEFDFSELREFPSREGGITYGLADDDYTEALTTLIAAHTALIRNPHSGDVLLFERGITVPLHAREAAEWRVNGEYVGSGREVSWTPTAPGTYSIEAENASATETADVTILPE